MAKKVGHLFLAELGKKRLRPGGIEATNWLMEQGQFTAEKKCWKLPVIWGPL